MKKTLLILCAILFSAILFAQDLKKVKITELETMIAKSEGPLIVNFWATFCKPCMEEIPHFQELATKYEQQGLEIIFVSLDMKDAYPAKINSFIRKLKMNSPSAWLDETNADYFCPKIDESWSGAIPATLFVNNGTGYRKFTEQSLTREMLESEIQSVMNGAGDKTND